MLEGPGGPFPEEPSVGRAWVPDAALAGGHWPVVFSTVWAALWLWDPGSSLLTIVKGILGCHISQLLFPLQINSVTFPRWKLLLPLPLYFLTVAPRQGK